MDKILQDNRHINKISKDKKSGIQIARDKTQPRQNATKCHRTKPYADKVPEDKTPPKQNANMKISQDKVSHKLNVT